MSMISPETFIEFECKGKSYKELLKIRDDLLRDVRAFEKGKTSSEITMHPSPEVIYQVHLEYLGELCKLIAEKYNSEVVWEEE